MPWRIPAFCEQSCPSPSALAPCLRAELYWLERVGAICCCVRSFVCLFLCLFLCLSLSELLPCSLFGFGLGHVLAVALTARSRESSGKRRKDSLEVPVHMRNLVNHMFCVSNIDFAARRRAFRGKQSAGFGLGVLEVPEGCHDPCCPCSIFKQGSGSLLDLQPHLSQNMSVGLVFWDPG